jgi:hypothetical protein
MPTEAAFTDEEIAELRKLLEMEKIRKVKTLYSQLMDARDWDGFSMIFWDDAVAELGEYGNWRGRAEIKARISGATDDTGDDLPTLLTGRIAYDGLHLTTNLWIELTSPTTAVSRCYLHDVLFEAHPRINPLLMFGIYDEDYEKRGGEWKIARFRVQFLWPDRVVLEDFPRRMAMTAIG